MSTDCVFASVDGWVIVVHSPRPPSIDEWAALLEFYQAHPSRLKGILVYTEGGALSAFQRKQLRKVFGEDARLLPRTAILTNSALVRLGITAFNLFVDLKIRAFEINAPSEAMRYLNIPPPLYAEILRKMQALAQLVNASTPPTYRVN